MYVETTVVVDAISSGVGSPNGVNKPLKLSPRSSRPVIVSQPISNSEPSVNERPRSMMSSLLLSLLLLLMP